MAKDIGFLINHCVGVILRLTGNGVLRPSLYDLGVQSETLPTITMQSNTGKFGVSISNFKSQKMQLELKTTTIDEKFRIGNIAVYLKPTSTGYPY